jgi:hypothetical protein
VRERRETEREGDREERQRQRGERGQEREERQRGETETETERRDREKGAREDEWSGEVEPDGFRSHSANKMGEEERLPEDVICFKVSF